MRTIYDTTHPTRADTRATAKGKWLQQLANPSSATAGLILSPQVTSVEFHDTKLKTLQKILKKLQ